MLCAGCIPAQSVSTPSPEPRLEVLGSRALSGDYAALGLTGENKPNGMQYRLRRSVPGETPAFVPRRSGGLELFIADRVPEGWLAFHRDPLGRPPGAANPRFRAALYSPSGQRLWELDLNRFLSRPDHLEIQDIRLRDGELYFNEACQSYSREAGGMCSSLVRVDPRRGVVVWRTRPLVSNDIFLVHGDRVIAGYGFTAEPDSLFLVARATGEVQARHPLDSAHSYLEMVSGRLVVVTRHRVYEMGV